MDQNVDHRGSENVENPKKRKNSNKKWNETKRKPKDRDLVSSDPESDENQDFVEINGDKVPVNFNDPSSDEDQGSEASKSPNSTQDDVPTPDPNGDQKSPSVSDNFTLTDPPTLGGSNGVEEPIRDTDLDPETGKLLNDVFEGKKEDNKTFDSDRKPPKLPRPRPKDDLKLMTQMRKEEKED